MFVFSVFHRPSQRPWSELLVERGVQIRCRKFQGQVLTETRRRELGRRGHKFRRSPLGAREILRNVRKGPTVKIIVLPLDLRISVE